MLLTKEKQAVLHNTFVIERSYPAAPERVFAALSKPEQKRRWLLGEASSPGDLQMDFRIGGSEHARSIIGSGPYQGVALTTDSIYQDIVPEQRVVMAARMMLADKCISVSLVTFEVQPENDGETRLILTHQAAFFEGSDGPQMREGGWRRLLDQIGEELAR